MKEVQDKKKWEMYPKVLWEDMMQLIIILIFSLSALVIVRGNILRLFVSHTIGILTYNTQTRRRLLNTGFYVGSPGSTANDSIFIKVSLEQSLCSLCEK